VTKLEISWWQRYCYVRAGGLLIRFADGLPNSAPDGLPAGPRNDWFDQGWWLGRTMGKPCLHRCAVRSTGGFGRTPTSLGPPPGAARLAVTICTVQSVRSGIIAIAVFPIQSQM